jgi:hypothetical protein
LSESISRRIRPSKIEEWRPHLYYCLQPGRNLLEQYCEDNDTFQEVEKQETNKPAK